HLLALKPGEVLNMVMPLGNGFPVEDAIGRVLLVGGGVGTAPLLYLGKVLCDKGVDVNYLIGARTKNELLMIDNLKEYGKVYISTDDGSAGDPGLVTQNKVWNDKFDRIYCCGPAPMMKGVARNARKSSTQCYVSLENMMACGVGACLCCVEKTTKGNVCVCTEGPVFEINQLTWQD
ncbi:MAG: dihydroorotate dehydrogenase electron transfer subunit, partial [Muribaculaceae bacterium]|nr:dihydroorotate dehydrogenase electron transfer subunit [Muribaculaceae bacterium]